MRLRGGGGGGDCTSNNALFVHVVRNGLFCCRDETNEHKVEYPFENGKGEQTNSHIHVQTVKCTLYMYMI